MSRTSMIRSVAFGVIVAGGVLLGSAPANGARAAANRAPVFDTAEECQDYCIIDQGKAHYSWDPRTGACHCF